MKALTDPTISIPKIGDFLSFSGFMGFIRTFVAFVVVMFLNDQVSRICCLLVRPYAISIDAGNKDSKNDKI